MPDRMPDRRHHDAPTEAPRTLADLRFAVAGPGRVGSSLAAWAVARGARLVRVAARRPEAARELAIPREAETAALDELESGDCDLLLVSVADGALAEVAEVLSARPQARVALHTSGSLGASILAPLAAAPPGSPATAVGSFHPLKAFPRPLPGPDDLARAAGTFYALDGAPAALALGARLAAAFDGVSGVVPEPNRDLYHFGATVAAGGVATLVVSAAGLAAGIGPEEGTDQGLAGAILRGYLALARSALDALAAAVDSDPSAPGATAGAPGAVAAAVTGPLARGDHATFLREMESLRAAGDPGDGRLDLFCGLGLETVRLTAGDTGVRALAAALHERGLPVPAALRSRPADC